MQAFVTGGTFCVLGEVMKQLMMKYLNLSKKDSLLYVTIELILLSVLLTGFNFYGKITKFGGAGGLVPITGFANSVASAAIEYQKEGQVLVLALEFYDRRTVILYGIFIICCWIDLFIHKAMGGFYDIDLWYAESKV